MTTALILIVALLVGGVALFLVLKPDVPGASNLDARGNVDPNRAPAPDTPDDQLGANIAAAVAAGLQLANSWYSKSGQGN